MRDQNHVREVFAKNLKGDKKTRWSWMMFDWANSAYSLVITSAVFPAFYEAITSTKDANGDVIEDIVLNKYGIPNTSMYAYFISAGFLIVALIAPLLSGIADYSNNKKSFMKFFTYIGSFSCMSLYFFNVENLLVSLIPVALASVGYAGSIVFYDAFLPEIAETQDQDKLSAKGFSMGYIGSVLLLIFCLIMISFPNKFGLEDSGAASRISFILVGIWWIAFANITFKGLAKEPKLSKVPSEILTKGYSELRKVWVELKKIPVLKYYLSAYFFFNMGVLTVMYMAANFAAKEIKEIDANGVIGPMKESNLIITILIIQLVASVGAYIFSYLSKKIGNLNALMIAILIWSGICITAYFIEYSTAFFVLAGTVGLVMGGIQALSRSTYSKLLPDTVDHASYFSFFEVCQFTGIILGTVSFGFIFQITNNLRYSILAVLIYFLIGIVLLKRVSKADTTAVNS